MKGAEEMRRKVALIVCGMKDAAIYARLLARDEFKCIVVSDAMAAGQAIKREAPHLVIVDNETLGGQGVAFVAQLRNVYGLVGVPILFMSSVLSESLALAAREAGATNVLRTPLRPSEVVGALRFVFAPSICGSMQEEEGVVEEDDNNQRGEPQR